MVTFLIFFRKRIKMLKSVQILLAASFLGMRTFSKYSLQNLTVMLPKYYAPYRGK
jgi:hypothetical protein